MLDDPDARVPRTVMLAIWREAARRSGDDAFGIHAAEQLGPEHLDLLGYAFCASATLGDGLQRIVRYSRVLHDVAVISVEVKGERVHLTHRMPAEVGPMPRHAAEFNLAAMLVAARKATAVDIAPLEVRFRHSPPQDLAEHRRVFRAQVRFVQAANELVISQALLDQPLVKSDPGLCAILERHLRESLDRIPTATSLSARVRHILAADVAANACADTVAQKLHMSYRTLQRQLGREGTSFRGLLDDLRRELAISYLAETHIAIAEIAFLVGFSEASAFHHAFRRWHGTTPAEYRQGRSRR